MLAALASGVLLGFSAGLSPGPMLALVLAQTLNHGPREGCKVALTPLVTDPPIILAAVALASRLADLRLPTNLLNPHPWLFWLTVGAAVLARAMARGWPAAAAFLFGFYLLLVGAKMAVALLAGRYRNLLAGRAYRAAMRGLAALLAVFAVLLLWEGLALLAAA